MNDDHKPFPTHAELQEKIGKLQALVNTQDFDLTDKAEHIARLIETAQAEQSENDTLRALNADLQSLNAELMEQVGDLQASEAKTYRALEDMRQRDDNLNDALRDELALTAELQAEVGRLQVVEAQNADALMGMNDQVIDLHTKLNTETARANEMHRQRDLYIVQVRELTQAQARVALQVNVLRKVTRLLRNEVKI